jgi:lysophospholipase L1-like esterase
MLECLILGDSIAVGIAQHRPDCVAHAKVGITSRKWNQTYSKLNLEAKTVIISLGSNDSNADLTYREITALRKRIGEDTQVFWVLPAHNHDMQEAIYYVASDFRDGVLGIENTAKDRVHPTAKEYKRLANVTK